MASSVRVVLVSGLVVLFLTLAPQTWQVEADSQGAVIQLIPATAPSSPPVPTAPRTPALPPPPLPTPPPAPLNCTLACAFRCSKAGRPNVCARACHTCCDRCKCVPPGTSGNQEVCGTCYTGQTTHGNKIKCP